MKKTIFHVCLITLAWGFAVSSSTEAAFWVGSYSGNDKLNTVNAVIIGYNGTNDIDDPDLLTLASYDSSNTEKVESIPKEWKSGTISWEGNWTYLVLKYGKFFDLYYVWGEKSLTIPSSYLSDGSYVPGTEPLTNGLSHYTLSAPVHASIPAPVLLLASGLIGFAAFRGFRNSPQERLRSMLSR